MDHFAEYLVQKRPTSQDRLKQGLIVAAAVVLSVLIGAISVLTGWLFLLVLVIGAIYGAYYLLTGCYTEYEYTVTNGELDVDKIAGRRKRSHFNNHFPISHAGTAVSGLPEGIERWSVPSLHSA